jgi:hypothetical protein
MGSYSGSDSTVVYLDVVVSKLPNSTLSFFEQNNKEKIVEVWIKENSIEKFYFHDLDLDLKEFVDENTANFIKDFYENNDNENLIQEAELAISYDVSGYYDPGRTYGPPENCYPEEWDEERAVTSAELILDEKSKAIVVIPSQYCDKIYDVFQKEVDESEFSPPDDDDYDPPDDDDDYDSPY